MKEHRKNIIRSFFLLLVFSLNTVAGFACSIGIDMGYNSNHHSKALSRTHTESYSHTGKHKCTNKQQATKKTKTSDSHDCCSNEVAKFIQLDKSVVGGLQLQPTLYLLSFFTAFIVPEQTVSTITVNAQFQFARRSCFLNDINIQTAIRRFQI